MIYFIDIFYNPRMAPPRLCCSLIVSCKLASMWFLLFSRVWLFATPRTVACQASLSFTVSQSLLIFMSTELMMPSSQLVLYCPLLLLPSIFPSIRVFSNESALCVGWSEYWKSETGACHFGGFVWGRDLWFVLGSGFLVLTSNKIGEGNGTPLQYSCLENPMDGGAW